MGEWTSSSWVGRVSWVLVASPSSVTGRRSSGVIYVIGIVSSTYYYLLSTIQLPRPATDGEALFYLYDVFFFVTTFATTFCLPPPRWRYAIGDVCLSVSHSVSLTFCLCARLQPISLKCMKCIMIGPTNRKSWLTFGGDPVHSSIRIPDHFSTFVIFLINEYWIGLPSPYSHRPIFTTFGEMTDADSLKGHSGAELHIYFLVRLESIYYQIFFYSKIVPNCAVAK